MRFIFLITILVFASCSSETEDQSKLDVIQSIVAIDHGNNGNVTDIIVSFKKARNTEGITEYRLYIINESRQFNDIDLFDIPNYQSFSPSTDQQVRLPEELKDIDGNQIVEGISYIIAIASVDDLNQERTTVVESRALELKDTPYYDVETLAILPGVEALTFNPNTKSLYTSADSGEDGNVIEINAHTGDFTVWANRGGWGGSFNQDYSKFYLSIPTNNTLVEYEIATETWNEIATDINRPTGTAVDKDGNIYVASYNDDTIFKVTPSGTKSVHASGGALNSVDGIIFINDILYAINFETPTIVKINEAGEAVLFATLPSNSPITGYMTFVDGYIYAGSGTWMYRIDLDGRVETLFGTSESEAIDGPAPFASSTEFSLGIAANTAGDSIYFAGRRRIRMLIRRE